MSDSQFYTLAKTIQKEYAPQSALVVGQGANEAAAALRGEGVNACAANAGALPSDWFELAVLLPEPADTNTAVQLAAHTDQVVVCGGDLPGWAATFSTQQLLRASGQHMGLLLNRSADIPDTISRYEQLLLQADEEKLLLQQQLKQQEQRNARQAAESTKPQPANTVARADYRALEKKYWQLLQRADELETDRNRYQAIAESNWWKVTKPLRVAYKYLHKVYTAFRLIGKGVKSLFTSGWRSTWHKVHPYAANESSFHKYMLEHKPSASELKQQRETAFANPPLISIVVPLYNTPDRFLCEMIESVQAQTYPHWQLCLADGSDGEHAGVAAACRSYAEQDKRIRYQKLERNTGISGNTNAALAMADGDYIALLDHDDLLHPSALFRAAQAIQNEQADFVYTDEMTFRGELADYAISSINFKPDFNIDLLRSYNYICHLTVFKKSLQQGGFSDKYNGSQDYDMILRLTEQAQKIVHIPEVLYFWRSHAASTSADIAAKPYCMESAKRALDDHLKRVGLKGRAEDASLPSTYRIRYELDANPLISILIPNMDHTSDLGTCINAILEKSTYQNFEIVVLENNSRKQETFDFYETLTQRDSRIRIVKWDGPFNYPDINNFGAEHAKGEMLLLLNNDIEIITPDWLQEMLMFAQRRDVGAVGAKLYYPDDTVQHAGVIVGIGGVAGHAHKYYQRTDPGYMGRAFLAQDLSAVTAACLMVSKQKYEQIGGMDNGFAVAFNDVDFCLRLREAGYLNVFTPFAECYHHESKSRGAEDTKEKQQRFQGEVLRFQARWEEFLKKGDPFYSPHLSDRREDFSLK